MPSQRKKTKGASKRGPRKTKRSAAVSIRIQEDLRAALQDSADAKGITLSNDISLRLQASIREDSHWGSEEEKELSLLMGSRFFWVGDVMAEEKFGPDTPPIRWLSDNYCFDQAAMSVIIALWSRRPDRSQEGRLSWLETLKARMACQPTGPKGSK